MTRATLAPSVRSARRVRQARKAPLVLPEPLARRVRLVLVVNRGRKAFRANVDRRVHRGHRAKRVIPARKALKERPALP